MDSATKLHVDASTRCAAQRQAVTPRTARRCIAQRISRRSHACRRRRRRRSGVVNRRGATGARRGVEDDRYSTVRAFLARAMGRRARVRTRTRIRCLRGQR